VCSLDELFQLSSLSLGIWVAPMCTMIGVVFRAIDIDVEFVLAVKLELAKTVLMTPRIAIEALDDTSATDAWPVTNLEALIKETELFIF
jgi:hypothetical protein